MYLGTLSQCQSPWSPEPLWDASLQPPHQCTVRHISANFKERSETSFPLSKLLSTHPLPRHPHHPLCLGRRNTWHHWVLRPSWTTTKPSPSVLALSRRSETDLWWKERRTDTIAWRDYFGYRQQKTKSNRLKQNKGGKKKHMDSFN